MEVGKSEGINFLHRCIWVTCFFMRYRFRNGGADLKMEFFGPLTSKGKLHRPSFGVGGPNQSWLA